MVAVTWLTVGVVFIVHAILTSRTESHSLSVVGKAAAELQVAYARTGYDNFNELIQQLRRDNQLTTAAVLNVEGKFAAHTNPAMIGMPAAKQAGQEMRWGNVEATRFLTPQERTLVEYRVPLMVGPEAVGELWISSPAPDLWTTAMDAAEKAPMAVVVPLLLVGVGAMFLRRIAQPIAGVHHQLIDLSRQAPNGDLACEKLPPSTPANIGWNRLIDEMQQSQQAGAQPSVTERVSAAIQNRKQQESLHILQQLADGLAVTDPEGRITFANRAVAALLGESVEADDSLGNSLAAYLAGRIDNPEALEVFAAGGSDRSARTEVTRSSGDRKRILNVARQPIDGGASGHVWSLRDVTQQKMADEMRGQFIDSATHELRTPLANIKAYSETLAMMDDVDLEQQKEFCNTINSEATRLARFVDDLLSVSSMEVGSMTINRQNVNLARLFDEVVDKVRPLTVAKSQQFAVHLPEKLGETLLDKDKVSAMLVNLLGNASKYTPQGGDIALHVKVSEGLLSVGIEDSGVGISEEELGHVFDKFFRSKDPRVQNETGTGLGLSLAREIVRLHGGELTVKSTVDKGSIFVATLPVMQEARL